MRGRLVEHEHGRVGEERARDRRGADAGRRRAARPPRRRACRARRAATRPTRRGARGRERPRARRRSRPGARAARFARMVELKMCASWPASANVRRTSSCRSSRTSRPPTVTRPSLGIEEAQQQVRDRRLAGAARPDERDPPPRLEPQVEAGATQAAPAARSARSRPRARRPPGARARGSGPAGSRIAGSRSISSSTRRPAASVAESSRAAAAQRRDASNDASASSATRRHEHAVERTALASDGEHARRRSGPATRIESPSARPAASASRRPRRASSPLRARTRGQGVLLAPVDDELRRAAQQLDELGGQLGARGSLATAGGPRQPRRQHRHEHAGEQEPEREDRARRPAGRSR